MERHCPKLFNIQHHQHIATLLPPGQSKTPSSRLPGGAITTSLCFIPGTTDIITTVNTDGTLCIYDTRSQGKKCANSISSTNSIVPETTANINVTPISINNTVSRISPYSALFRAHIMDTAGTKNISTSTNKKNSISSTSTAPCISSVQAIDNYIITGGAFDGIVRFWDIRKLPSLSISNASSIIRSPSLSNRQQIIDNTLLQYHVPFENDGSGAVYSISQPHISSSLTETSFTALESSDLNELHSSSSTSISTPSIRYYGISSMDISPDVKYGAPIYGTSSLTSCSLLVAYKSSRILIYNLSQILNGGSNYYNSTNFDTNDIFVCKEVPISSAINESQTNPNSNKLTSSANSVLGKRSHSLTTVSPSATINKSISRPIGSLSYITPPRTTIRASRAWDSLHRSCSFDDLNISPSSNNNNTSTGKYTFYKEYGGHYNTSLYIYARFSRCGQFISSGSMDGRGYIWDITKESASKDTYDTDTKTFVSPVYVLGDQGSIISNVEWGGNPVLSSSTSTPLSTLPNTNLRIATLADHGYIRVWGICPSEDPEMWFEENKVRNKNTISSSVQNSQQWRQPVDKNIVDSEIISNDSSTTESLIPFSTNAYDFTIHNKKNLQEEWISKGFSYKLLTNINLSMTEIQKSKFISLAIHEGNELFSSMAGGSTLTWSIPYTIFTHPKVIDSGKIMYRNFERNFQPLHQLKHSIPSHNYNTRLDETNNTNISSAITSTSTFTTISTPPKVKHTSIDNTLPTIPTEPKLEFSKEEPNSRNKYYSLETSRSNISNDLEMTSKQTFIQYLSSLPSRTHLP